MNITKFKRNLAAIQCRESVSGLDNVTVQCEDALELDVSIYIWEYILMQNLVMFNPSFGSSLLIVWIWCSRTGC